MAIQIKGYLTEKKLGKLLNEIFGKVESQVPLPDGRRRWDFRLNIGDRILVVEYDGNDHYQDALRIKGDHDKDEVAKELGYQVVRIPYFVQLTTETLRHYFGAEEEIVQDFHHGFITTRVFPASYCEQGIERFRRQLESLPERVRIEIVKSLKDRAAEYGHECVVPATLDHLLEE